MLILYKMLSFMPKPPQILTYNRADGIMVVKASPAELYKQLSTIDNEFRQISIRPLYSMQQTCLSEPLVRHGEGFVLRS